MSEGERQRLVSYVVRCGTRTQLDLGGWTCCCVLLFIVAYVLLFIVVS